MDTTKKAGGADSLVVSFAPWMRLFRGSTRVITFTVVTFVVLIGGSMWAWKHWGRHVVQDPRFQLSREAVELTPPPEWIHSDLAEEVLSDPAFRQASLLEPDLTIRLARAFATHPWVHKVRRVIKTPQGKVLVELDYRMPVAMVEVDDAVFAVDENAVVLPSDYFLANPAAIRLYPRIKIDGASLYVPVGTAWGDHRIASAAKIATTLFRNWSRYGLYRISLLTPVSIHQSIPGVYVLTSRSGARVLWGHAPRYEVAGEPVTAEKIRRLDVYVDRNGTFADKTSNVELDLNETTLLSLPAATARRPGPVDGPDKTAGQK